MTKIKKQKIILLFKILILNLILIYYFNIIVSSLDLTFPIYKYKNKIFDDIFLSYLLIVVFLPLLEEIVFRLPLVKSKFSYLSLFFIFFYAVIINNLYLKGLFFLYLLLIVYSLKFKAKTFILKIICILSLFIFVSSHIGNYDNLNNELLINFFLFFPQIIIGSVLIWIRLKQSFRYSVIYHSIYNFIVLTIAIYNN